jgi:hypothetical protein
LIEPSRSELPNLRALRRGPAPTTALANCGLLTAAPRAAPRCGVELARSHQGVGAGKAEEACLPNNGSARGRAIYGRAAAELRRGRFGRRRVSPPWGSAADLGQAADVADTRTDCSDTAPHCLPRPMPPVARRISLSSVATSPVGDGAAEPRRCAAPSSTSNRPCSPSLHT